MDSPAIATSAALPSSKSRGDKKSAPDDKAFSISLEVARDEAGGEPASPQVIAQSLTANADGHAGEELGGAGDTLSISVTLSEDGTTGGTETTSITTVSYTHLTLPTTPYV